MVLFILLVLNSDRKMRDYDEMHVSLPTIQTYGLSEECWYLISDLACDCRLGGYLTAYDCACPFLRLQLCGQVRQVEIFIVLIEDRGIDPGEEVRLMRTEHIRTKRLG